MQIADVGPVALLVDLIVMVTTSVLGYVTVATMVIFGTVTMFLYPAMRGELALDSRGMGIYTGATLQV
jgi:uncharacterized membrane protein YadS